VIRALIGDLLWSHVFNPNAIITTSVRKISFSNVADSQISVFLFSA
jgi:hypothetical protein